MTITITLPDWTAWSQWLQTPLSEECGFKYWHLAALITYLLASYLIVVITLLRFNKLDALEEQRLVLFFPLAAPFILVWYVVWTLARILIFPVKVLRKLKD